MTASRIENSGSFSRIRISWSEGVIRLHDEDLFGKSLGEQCISFLRRVFALREVAWVEIDSTKSFAGIHFDANRSKLPDLLQHMAVALRGVLPSDACIPSHSFMLDLAHSIGQLKIQRLGKTLTTWYVIHDRPGRLRLRHQAIRGDKELARRLYDAVGNVAGVIECTVGPRTGSVLIRFDPNLTSSSSLLKVLDQARHAYPSTHTILSGQQSAGFGLANTSVALAVAGEMVAPFLLPASAVLLVGSNLNTFRAAGRQLLRGQIGLPFLYTSIVGATLASGQFIASAAMSWMLTFWGRQFRNDLTSARRRLLGQIIHQPRYVRLVTPNANSTHIEVPIEDLNPNDVILVSSGEQIPADGRVVEGYGLVDERMIRGLTGLSHKQPDDEVLAGSTIQLGELHVQVLQHGSQTHVARLGRATLAATTMPHGSRTPTLRGEKFAEQTVAPTIAIASLGLLLGDASTAGAILRPDYATGPGVAFPLETVQAIALCLRHGILIREPEAIERLAAVDLLIIDHHTALDRAELELDAVQTFPGHLEDEVLCYAATAIHNLDDDRAVALDEACRARKILLLDLQPTELTRDLTLIHGKNYIKVGDLGTRARSHANSESHGRETGSQTPDSLMVGVNGQVAGLIHFRRSDRLEAISVLRRLRTKRNLLIGIISSHPNVNLASLTTVLNADFHIGDLSAEGRIHFLQNCRRRGFKVAYVGDCGIDPRVAAEVEVAISLVESKTSSLDQDPASISLLQPHIVKLGELWDIASVHRRRVRDAHTYTFIPNLICIAGAFVWGFTSLASVVLTNLGTYFIYSRTAASIRSLEHQLARTLSTRKS